MPDDLNDLNDLINDIARDMTSGPPDVELARRVSARIGDARGRQDLRRWSRGWVLAPAAAACALALAVFVARETREPRRPVPAAATTTNAAPAAAAPALSTPVAPVTPGGTVPRAARLAAAPPAPPGLEPLTLASIDVERVEITPLARSERISIGPLAIERIEIAAIEESAK
jgi:hypothetical protein